MSAHGLTRRPSPERETAASTAAGIGAGVAATTRVAGKKGQEEDGEIGIGEAAPHGPAIFIIANITILTNITLLLLTGARHPYRIDDRYLGKRSVDVPEDGKAETTASTGAFALRDYM